MKQAPLGIQRFTRIANHAAKVSHLRRAVARRRAIFKDRGVEVDFQPNLGKDKDKLAETIDGFDGLAIRSATKVTAEDSGAGART